MINPKITKKMSIKDIQNSLEVSYNTAQKIYSDIKKEYQISIVTLSHYYKYLKIPK